MNIYVAGNYKFDRHRVAEIARILEQHGHVITFRWWDTPAPGKAKAQLDLAGVLRADALIVYMEYHREYRGTWIEVGAALITGKPVYFIGGWNSDLIFRKHPLSKDFAVDFPDETTRLKVLEAL